MISHGGGTNISAMARFIPNLKWFCERLAAERPTATQKPSWLIQLNVPFTICENVCLINIGNSNGAKTMMNLNNQTAVHISVHLVLLVDTDFLCRMKCKNSVTMLSKLTDTPTLLGFVYLNFNICLKPMYFSLSLLGYTCSRHRFRFWSLNVP